jgi:hypothetical protein
MSGSLVVLTHSVAGGSSCFRRKDAVEVALLASQIETIPPATTTEARHTMMMLSAKWVTTFAQE